MRKEQHIGQNRLRLVLRRESLAVNGHEVGRKREADEGYAERKRHIQQAVTNPEKRTEHVAIDEVGIFEDRERQQQHGYGENGMPRGCRRIGLVDPSAAEIGGRHQNKRNPEIFELPPRIENRAAGDDERKPVLSRNDKMQSEIDGKEDKKYRRAKYHDNPSIASSSNGTCRIEPDMQQVL